MLGKSYADRLERDLPQWIAAGWISRDGANAILSEVQERESGETGSHRLIGILSVLGAVLIGAGVLSFVAANWEAMPRLARLGLLVGAIWTAYVGAAITFQRGLDMFAHALVLLGSVIFGASIMLIAQMYHMNGNPPDTVVLWAAGALLAGAAFGSNPSIVFSLLLACLWAGWETQLQDAVFWPFVPVWALLAGLLVWRDCRYGEVISAFAIGTWIVSLGYLLPDGPNHSLVMLLGALIAGIGLALTQTVTLYERHGRLLLVLGYVVIFAAMLAEQFFTYKIPFETLAVLALITFAVSVAAMWWGIRTNDKTLTRTAYAAFAIEVVGIYLKTIGSLMGTSMFFVSAGLGVIALATGAFWVNRRINGQPDTERAAS
ncbi:MAG: DUF2157 domain-containing protein [Filomicrobium sp.]